jgi:hypothetical protein
MTDSDWLLMIDSDEQLDVRTFDMLCETAHDKERPVVARSSLCRLRRYLASLIPRPVPAIFQDSPNGLLATLQIRQELSL